MRVVLHLGYRHEVVTREARLLGATPSDVSDYLDAALAGRHAFYWCAPIVGGVEMRQQLWWMVALWRVDDEEGRVVWDREKSRVRVSAPGFVPSSSIPKRPGLALAAEAEAAWRGSPSSR